MELSAAGVVENRRFMLVDAEGNRLRSSLTAWPVVVRGRYDPASERLWMRFPDRTEVEETALAHGERVDPKVGERSVPSRIVEGPWEEPLSRLAGKPVRVARPDEPGIAQEAPVTLVSEASLDRLTREAGRPVDCRRFRMLLTHAGCAEHEEDGRDGRLLQIGAAVVHVGVPVPRCAVTTRDPDTGVRDLDTLRLIQGYRGVRNGDAIDFGVYAWVERPGRVRTGDLVELVDEAAAQRSSSSSRTGSRP